MVGRVGLVVVSRFRDGEGEPVGALRGALHAALAALAERPGYVDGDVGRNLDEPGLWLLTTRWADVGSYRRALSAYEVRVTAVPTLSRAVDEPSAYETLEPGESGNRAQPRLAD